MAPSRQELKASIEIDWSKVDSKLREADERQKQGDAKAETLARKTKRIADQLREAQDSAKQLETKVQSRVDDMIKDFGKFATKAIVFDTLTSYSDIIPSQARPLAGIATAGIVATATTGNPIYGALAAMGKSIDFLRDAQREYQAEIQSIRDDNARRDEELLRFKEQQARQREQDAFKKVQEDSKRNLEVDREQTERIRNTWAMMNNLQN